MMLMIFTVIGVLIIIAGLYTKYVALPVKYVVFEGECANSRTIDDKLDLTKCTETTKSLKGDIRIYPVIPSGIRKGQIYISDPSSLTNFIITLGSLILAICALIYAYKKFVSKK